MFSELKKRIAAFFANMSLKKLMLIILIAICILFPTILAISNAIYTNIKEREPKIPPSVIIYDTSGNELFKEVYSSEALEGDSLVSIFTSIKTNLEKTSPITAEVATEKPLIAEITDEKGTTRLTCYFSFTHGNSYCVDENGQYYKIPSTYSDHFLSSTFAELLYSDATPPSLLTADGQKIQPANADWMYKDIYNSFKSAALIKTTADIITYDISGSISLEFEKAPDSCSVAVHDGSELIFEGTLDELEKITLDTSTELLLSVTAKWNEAKGKLFYGTVTYNFKVIIHNRAEFSINADTLSADGFVVLKATNISHPEKLSVRLPNNTASPKLYFIGETAYVAISYPHGYTESVYSVTLSYGISAKTFDIALTGEGGFDHQGIDASLDKLGVSPSSFTQTANGHIFLGGSQILPNELGYSQIGLIGNTVLIGTDACVSPFNIYTSDNYGAEVYSSVSGRVCAVGENKELGKYVVIDCGLGIKLWYFGLSSVSVDATSVVAVGDVIGATAELSFTTGDGFYLMASCGTNVIDPKFVFEKLT